MKKCPQTDKLKLSREKAERLRDKLILKGQAEHLRIYCCEFCSCWHLTHRRRYRW